MIVAGTEAGVVRVGGALWAGFDEEAVEGVTASALEAVMGASLWMGMGGILQD